MFDNKAWFFLQYFFIKRRKKKIFIEYRIVQSILRKVVASMEITDVRLRRIDTEGKMKAVASVTFDNDFVVHDIKVIESQNGLFIAMPSRKTPSGEFKDIAHPINSTTRERIQDAVLAKYETTEDNTVTGNEGEEL